MTLHGPALPRPRPGPARSRLPLPNPPLSSRPFRTHLLSCAGGDATARAVGAPSGAGRGGALRSPLSREVSVSVSLPGAAPPAPGTHELRGVPASRWRKRRVPAAPPAPVGTRAHRIPPRPRTAQERRGLAAGSRRGWGAPAPPARGHQRPLRAAEVPPPPSPGPQRSVTAALGYRYAAAPAGFTHGISLRGGGVRRRVSAALPPPPAPLRLPPQPLRPGRRGQTTLGIPRGTRREAPVGSGGRCPAALRGLRTLPGRAGGRAGGWGGRGKPRRAGVSPPPPG